MSLLKIFKFITFVIAVMAINSACSEKNPKQGLIDEANAICDLFNKKRLNKLYSDPKTYNINQLAIDTRNTLKSKEFKTLFKELATSGYRDYYAALQPRVSNLLGEKWHCPNMQAYYDVFFISSNAPKDPSGKYEIKKIRVTPTGLIKIHNVFFDFKDTKNWIEKLRETITSDKPWLIFVLIPEDKYTDKDVSPLLTLFKELKFETSQYSFRQYRISEYEALEKINANNP